MLKMSLTVDPKVMKVDVDPTGSSNPVKIGLTNTNVNGPPFATYIHDQMVASNSWVIEHNLNCYPSVSVVDTGGNVVIGDIQYISDKKIIISFTNMFSGKAYIN